VKRAAVALAGLLGWMASMAPAGARADASVSPGTGATLSFSTLPGGHVPGLPASPPPASVSAREHVEGLTTAGMPPKQLESMKRTGNGILVTYVSEKADRDDKSGTDAAPSDTCFVDGGDAQSLKAATGENASDETKDWPTGFAQKISLTFASGGARTAPVRHKRRGIVPGNRGDVHAVHAERFVPGADGHASLSIVDAWVDARTRGARAYARSTLPLARVFVGPNGLEVYAAGDGERVQVVFRSPVHPVQDPDVSQALLARVRSLSATTPELGGANSDCGHLRVALRPFPGDGKMVTLASTAFLPALGEPVHPPDGETPEQRGQRLADAMRQRPFSIAVSATSLSGDERPVVSIALGWSGKETRDSGSGA
jgi:hypothetical protein